MKRWTVVIAIWLWLMNPSFSQETKRPIVQHPIIQAFEVSIAELRAEILVEEAIVHDRFNRLSGAIRSRDITRLEEARKMAMVEDDLDKAIMLRDLANDLRTRKLSLHKEPAEPEIPADANKFGKHRYVIVKDAVTWHVAREIAKSRAGHLARITSEEEFDFVRKLCREDGFVSYWVDGSDEAEEGKWLFSDGTAADFEFLWIPPSNGKANVPDDILRQEHHVELKKDSDYFGNDVPAGLRRPFIIEWDL